MIKLFRKIRQQLITENKFSKYLLYAVGEIVLVVIGIMIALQLNNRNKEKQEQVSLEGYLNSISKNIDSDIKKAQFINDKREKIIHRDAIYLDYYDISDIKLISKNVIDVAELDYFNANLSGFESLKNSGYLSKLQGTDIEELLYTYYNLVNEITLIENNYNRNIENGMNQFSSADIDGLWLFWSPEYIGEETTSLNDFQPFIKPIIDRPWSFWVFNKPEKLIILYDNLSIIGEELTWMIRDNKKNIDDIAKSKLSLVFDINGTIGYPIIIQNGNLSSFYQRGLAAFNNFASWSFNKPNSIEANFPEMEWGYLYFFNDFDTTQNPLFKDYSIYNSIKLELKASKGGELVYITIKDKDDANNGNETRIPLTLTNTWETYEIPLSHFKSTNFKEVHVAAGLLFLDNAKSVSIRHIEYLR